MKPGYHFSIDDVFDSLLMVSDWRVRPHAQPFFAFCAEIAAEGAVTDLYLFRSSRGMDGRTRRLDEAATPATADAFSNFRGVRFGPHAEDYATAPHAQTLEAQTATMSGLFDTIARFTMPESRSRWVRLHYFSECFEIAPVFLAVGVEALLTTDKPALTYRMDPEAAKNLRLKGRTEINNLAMIRSHLRLENHVIEARDPARFHARIDEALDMHGFVTLFTHEIDMADERVRTLAHSSVRHLARCGIPAI